MSGIDGVSGPRTSPWEDRYEKPLPNQDRRTAENVANSPWLVTIPPTSTINRETKREDFVVGPNALATFTADPKTYSEVALRVFAGGEPDLVTLESMKAVDLAMKEGPVAAIKQLGKAWKTALSDADWVAKRATDVALAARAAAPRTPAAAATREATAVEGSAEAVDRARRHKPTFKATRELAPGEGTTDKYGNVEISKSGTPKDRALAAAHESVHSALSPKAMNGLREFRANVGMLAYEKSALCKYLEEALAESYAQVKVNGWTALPEGLTFPIREGYVSLSRTVGEAAIGTIVYGGVLYGVYVAASK